MQHKKIRNRSRYSLKNLHKSILNRKAIRIIIVLILIIVFSSFIIPVSYDITEDRALSYGTDYKDEIALEMGIQQTASEGSEGKGLTVYKHRQSLFDYVFRRNNVSKKEISTTITKPATNKIVFKGTRKWQYMKCSNGVYRYFTDEQFKNPSTGFTSKSPDDCKNNNQGTKIGLADTATGVNKTYKPSNTPAGCTTVEIPYKTIYKDASWLNEGQTQEGFGANGYKYVCTNTNLNAVISPLDKTIYRGTAKSSTPTYTPTLPDTPTPDYAAKRICDSDYSRAKAQLNAANAGNSSAMLQVEQLYLQCLRRAGF